MGPKTQPEWVEYTSVYLGSDPNLIIPVSEQIQIILLMLLWPGRGFSGRVSSVQITSVKFRTESDFMEPCYRIMSVFSLKLKLQYQTHLKLRHIWMRFVQCK